MYTFNYVVWYVTLTMPPLPALPQRQVPLLTTTAIPPEPGGGQYPEPGDPQQSPPQQFPLLQEKHFKLHDSQLYDIAPVSLHRATGG